MPPDQTHLHQWRKICRVSRLYWFASEKLTWIHCFFILDPLLIQDLQSDNLSKPYPFLCFSGLPDWGIPQVHPACKIKTVCSHSLIIWFLLLPVWWITTLHLLENITFVLISFLVCWVLFFSSHALSVSECLLCLVVPPKDTPCWPSNQMQHSYCLLTGLDFCLSHAFTRPILASLPFLLLLYK